MYKDNKLIRVVKKYSTNKNILIISIDDKTKFNKISNKYKIIYNNNMDKIPKVNKNYETVVFNNFLEYMSKKEIEKIMKFLSKISEQVIFDVVVNNYFCNDDHKDTNYYRKKYYEEMINNIGSTIIEEINYRSALFEKHTIFIMRKR